jgi:DNA-binding response OmpR family regulator
MTTAIPSCRRRVLVVEDQADTRETLRLLLDLHGHEVEVARDGLEGLQKAVSFQPEVCVFDIGLPLCDGYQLAQEVRASLGQGPFLIALTAYTSAEDQRKSTEAGFDLHMAKPADPSELCRLVQAGRP